MSNSPALIAVFTAVITSGALSVLFTWMKDRKKTGAETDHTRVNAMSTIIDNLQEEVARLKTTINELEDELDELRTRVKEYRVQEEELTLLRAHLAECEKAK